MVAMLAGSSSPKEQSWLQSFEPVLVRNFHLRSPVLVFGDAFFLLLFPWNSFSNSIYDISFYAALMQFN
jgi:hypothetical protein